ncbi:Glutathione S-transferase TCHQD [Arachis hypogaea]|nr:Glutathione S-transferase TCHQD [Arachis hypogaea]
MQLYHHPFDLDSLKVRLALEEKGVDYTSHHVNPITGKNLDSSFFKMNPSGRLPVFQNGSHIIYKTIDIIQYIERIAVVSAGSENISTSGREVIEWMQKIQEWDPKFFSLSHIPEKYRIYVSKFIRRVVIAHVARRSEEHLVRLLDEVERQLGETPYLAGQDFTMADVVLIPVLARLVLLDLEKVYITNRPNIAEYWVLVQQRPSYKKVIVHEFEVDQLHHRTLRAGSRFSLTFGASPSSVAWERMDCLIALLLSLSLSAWKDGGSGG